MSGTALRGRLRLLDELRQIVTAMRNLAYAELQRVARTRDACENAERTVVRALADTVPDGLAARAPDESPAVWLVIGAERGFCGAFNDQLADALREPMHGSAGARWMFAGARLRQRVEGVVPDATWLAGCNGLEDAATCVDAWLSALSATTHAPAAAPPALRVMHHGEGGIVRRGLLPMPELPVPTPGPRPMRQLALAQLVPRLLAETLRVSLLGALYQSLQQENHARLAQMQRAEDYLDETRSRLRRRYFRQRQSEITSELETLMSSLDAAPDRRFRRPAGAEPAAAPRDRIA